VACATSIFSPRTELNSNGQPQNENHSSGNKLEGLEGDRARSEGPAVEGPSGRSAATSGSF
jgi:hypothetical protein